MCSDRLFLVNILSGSECKEEDKSCLINGINAFVATFWRVYKTVKKTLSKHKLSTTLLIPEIIKFLPKLHESRVRRCAWHDSIPT